MPYLFGTDSNCDVPVSLGFSFNGTSVSWGSDIAYHVEPLSNRAESIDGNYAVSDLDVQFIDTNGSLWGSLGYGTTAFNKEFSLTAYVGGTMDFSGGKLKLINGSNSGTYLLHTGKISYVARANRLVRIRSSNYLRLLTELSWRFPYRRSALTAGETKVGSYYFSDPFSSDKNYGTLYHNAMFNLNPQRDQFEFYAAKIGLTTVLETLYPTTTSRGSLGVIPPTVAWPTGEYFYPGTQFYVDATIAKYKGSFLGTKTGTIDSLEDANTYGYANVAAAEVARLASGDGSSYEIQRTRFAPVGGTDADTGHFFLQQNLTLSESPANLWRELFCGNCVDPYFTMANIDAVTFAEAQTTTAFQSFSYRVDPKGGKVFPAIKNIVESVFGLFAVNTESLFEIRPYGPKRIRVTPPTIGSTDVIDASYTNDIEDYFNRIVVNYNYIHDDLDFHGRYEVKAPGWDFLSDRAFTLDSKVIYNENNAYVFANRLLKRVNNTAPRLSITVPLKYAGALIGSLYSLQDPDTTTGTKIVEITQYSKDFSESKNVTLSGVDAEALYFRKGYAYWGTRTVLPGEAVTSASDSGWGVNGPNGTTPNINVDIHGTSFVWW